MVAAASSKAGIHKFSALIGQEEVCQEEKQGSGLAEPELRSPLWMLPSPQMDLGEFAPHSMPETLPISVLESILFVV